MMQLSWWDSREERCGYTVDAAELFVAYKLCRKSKRRKESALAFEVDYEENLVELMELLESGKWMPSPSLAFVVRRPVLREIFAAEFKDRVVHHWLMLKLNPLMEVMFSDHSYACRPGRGTHFGIDRIFQEMHSLPQMQFNPALFVMKLDISGFFMNINRDILWQGLKRFVTDRYFKPDLPLVLEILEKVVRNPAKDFCIRRGRRKEWKNLPRSKSLFYSPEHCGLPIGNLTSQILANFYLNGLDGFVTRDLGILRYGRYVDDMVLMHEDHAYLCDARNRIEVFLRNELGLTLHPNKFYLQHAGHGVPFLGMVIKPGRIVAGPRIKGNFYEAMQRWNRLIRSGKPGPDDKIAFLQCMNSYLGLLKPHKTYRLRRKVLFKDLSAFWLNHFGISGGYAKLVPLVRPEKASRRR
jgi:hypothetical protein